MFVNSFEVNKVQMYGTNFFNYFYFYKDDKIFQYAEFIQVKLGCGFAFQKFPFDYHECDFKFFSPNYDKYYLDFQQISLYNSQTGDIIQENETLFLTTDRLSFNISVTLLQDLEMMKVTGYDYNVQGFKLILSRSDIELLLSVFFIPTGLFTLFSLLSFLIPIKGVSLVYI